MSGIVQTEANNLLNGWFGIAAYTPVATIGQTRVALMTTMPDATTVGTEVSGGSYARQPVAWNAPANGATANSGAVTCSGMPACTVVAINIFDTSGTPVRRAFMPLAASKTLGAGDTLSFAAGQITASLT